ncbi:hypothetical protein KP509_06G032400 [Ceratopteris richardii]|uniref:LHY n=1 Tax=Ceratopteris richardii TaxID=49495 RepID=A0A8T2UMY5_CERRI|nr:hypothetical protein KP509_06G032400 [Ceratopteris richardii]
MSAAPVIISLKDGIFDTSSNARIKPSKRRMMNIDNSSSSDDISTRIRKPYTITKQREKWTDEEHQKFLEALKLYGRSWHQIKEYIGTKTTVQIRSHAQKFFVKLNTLQVEKGASGLNGETQGITIPPPRPKRKPMHPYPRKAAYMSVMKNRDGDGQPDTDSVAKVKLDVANESSKKNLSISAEPTQESPGECIFSEDGNDQSNMEELRTWKTNPRSISTGYSLLTKVNEIGHSKLTETIPARDNQVMLQKKHRSEGTSCNVKGLSSLALTNTYKSEIQHEELPQSEVNFNTTNHSHSNEYLTGCGSTTDAESQRKNNQQQETHYDNSQPHQNTKASVHIDKPGEQFNQQNNNQTNVMIADFLKYYEWLATLGRPHIPQPVPVHDHLPYLIPPWQFMQTHLMNHPAAFAAAMAATTLSMAGQGSSAPYSCKGWLENQLSPSGDLNMALFAAVSASWLAFSGFAHAPFGHYATNPLVHDIFKTLQLQNIMQQEVPSQASHPENEETLGTSSSPGAFKVEKNICRTVNTTENSSLTATVNCSTLDEGQKNHNPQIGLHGDVAVEDGSSSGSNTPALPSSEQDIPSVSEIESEENKNLCIPLDEAYKRAFQTLNKDELARLKARVSERGRPQQKESTRNTEHETGKRLKSSHYDMDFRKEVSLEGRKAFQALFNCKRLPQTFNRGTNTATISNQEKGTPKVASFRIETPSDLQAEARARNSSECAPFKEIIDHYSSCPHSVGSITDENISATCSQLKNESRASMSGFIPYQKSISNSRTSLRSNT